ncbi:MAG: response regulator transcription factor [Acetobacter sp.]|uniref:response regulator transcription factor n=1 Tax=Acetobacter sp. TaxID=440 RepID=UPI0039EB2DDF
MRVLIVEDEQDLGEAVLERVRQAGHAADWFLTLEDARAALATVDYDCMLLDLRLPDGSGRDLLRQIRATGRQIAILITTAEDQISDRVAGLAAGADDYIVKPFDLDELLARLNAVARRYVVQGSALSLRAEAGTLTVDRDHAQAFRNGEAVELTAREWAILELLTRRPGTLYSREQIETVLYDLADDVGSNTVEVFISRLRKKIGNGVIRTVRGRGYGVLPDGA